MSCDRAGNYISSKRCVFLMAAKGKKAKEKTDNSLSPHLPGVDIQLSLPSTPSPESRHPQG